MIDIIVTVVTSDLYSLKTKDGVYQGRLEKKDDHWCATMINQNNKLKWSVHRGTDEDALSALRDYIDNHVYE